MRRETGVAPGNHCSQAADDQRSKITHQHSPQAALMRRQPWARCTLAPTATSVAVARLVQNAVNAPHCFTWHACHICKHAATKVGRAPAVKTVAARVGRRPRNAKLASRVATDSTHCRDAVNTTANARVPSIHVSRTSSHIVIS